MRRIFGTFLLGVLIAALLALAAPPAKSAPAPSGVDATITAANFTDEDGVAEIPFYLHANHIMVRGRIGDSDSLWFIVDTGAYMNVVNASVANALGMESLGSAQAHGAGGTVESGRLGGVDFKMAGLEILGSPSHTIDLNPIVSQSGLPMDAIIGYPLFRDQVVEVDYGRSLLVVRPGKGYRYRGDGAVVPIDLIEHHPYITASVTLPGRQPVSGRFVLDTGSSLALTLGPSFVEKQRAIEAMPATMDVRTRGVGGANMQKIGRAEKLELGKFALDGPVTTMRTGGDGRISVQGSAGNIGGDVMRRFKVIFDYPRKQVIFEPSEAFDEPFEADMSGLIWEVRPAAEGATPAMRVIVVQAGSPAEAAGFREGDVLETFDGETIAPRMSADMKKTLKREGETHTFGIRREGERTELKLKTKRMI